MENFDHQLFTWVNQVWTNSWFDFFFPLITNIHHFLVIQIFLSIMFLVLIYYRRMAALKILVALGLAILISDTFSYRFLKSHIKRQRPHQIAEMNSVVRVPYAPQSPSFPSNHALNSTVLACVLVYYFPALVSIGSIFVLLIAYSRVYVGVHFPSDVVAGILIGLALFLVYKTLILKKIKWFRV